MKIPSTEVSLSTGSYPSPYKLAVISHFPTKNKTKSYSWPQFPCQLPPHFSALLCNGCPCKSSLHSLSQISLLPFFPKPTPVRLFSIETALVRATSDLHFATFNDQYPVLILPDLLAALDAADHFLWLDTISSLGFQGTMPSAFLLPLWLLRPPFPLLVSLLLPDLLSLEYFQVKSLFFFSSLYTHSLVLLPHPRALNAI